jgi:hypothetical protein
MHLEEELGVTIPDEKIEAVQEWEKLTLQDFLTVAERSAPSVSSSQVREALITAVQKAFPDAPTPLDLSAPLPDALSRPNSTHRYGGY